VVLLRVLVLVLVDLQPQLLLYLIIVAHTCIFPLSLLVLLAFLRGFLGRIKCV
jgi:hypothetical protein